MFLDSYEVHPRPTDRTPRVASSEREAKSSRDSRDRTLTRESRARKRRGISGRDAEGKLESASKARSHSIVAVRRAGVAAEPCTLQGSSVSRQWRRAD